MRKDPTEFRERFKKWQSGEKVYEAGLPKFEDGGESVRVGDYNVYPSAIGASELNVTTPEVVVTGKKQSYPDTSDYYLWNPSNFTFQKILDNKVRNLKAKENYDDESTRKRIYKNVEPYGYGIADMYKAEDKYNKNEGRKYAKRGYSAGLFGLEYDYGDIREAQWAKYLGLPVFKYNFLNEGLKTDSVKNVLLPPKYYPKKGTPNGDLVRLPPDVSREGELSDKVLAALYRSAQKGDSIVPLSNSPTLGRYTASIGKDSIGNYISYYDEWDLNPFKAAGYAPQDIRGLFLPKSIYNKSDIFQEYNIGHPFSLYDRRYYNDYDLKNALDKYSKKVTDNLLKDGAYYSGKTDERVR